MSEIANRIPVDVKEDFLKSLSSSNAINSLAELIWNGLDAGSDRIDVDITKNGMGGVSEIKIKDEGSGIPHHEIKSYFGNLGDSWKKNADRVNKRILHGKKGKGRFNAFGLGSSVTWETTFKDENNNHFTYQINGSSSELKPFSYTNPVPATEKTGTTVVVRNTTKVVGELLAENAPQELARLFAAYLSRYPNICINLNGECIDPGFWQEETQDVTLDPIELENGETIQPVVVNITEWKIPTEREMHLCDWSGVSLHEMKAGIRVPGGFNFTAYIKCDYFLELDKENNLILEELDGVVKEIVERSREAIRNHFRERLAVRRRDIVKRWRDENIYPYEEKNELNPVEEAERQFFDILGVNLETYLPKFGEADQNSRKFTFLLLAQALRDNPKSVQKIITEVLQLKKEEQDDLAALLKNTPFSHIISSAKIVANRLDFLLALENLIFDKETKAQLLERDQLHKILENEAWVFDEGFALSGSEERLEDVLKKHIGVLRKREDGETSVVVGDGKTGRVDLLLSRVISPRNGEHDYLVVELKRPSKKIDAEVITQIMNYAMAVADDERFHGIKAKWKFIAVSNEINEFAKLTANQRGRPKGIVLEHEEKNITVWVKEWAEVIDMARSRLEFINQELSYTASRGSAREYLLKVHAKYIPSLEKEDNASTDAAENSKSESI